MQNQVKRPLLVFLLGALCALSLSLFLPGALLLPGFLLFLLVGAVTSSFYRRGFVPALSCLLALGLAFGFLWHFSYHTCRVAPAEALDGQTVTLTVTAETMEEYGFVVDDQRVIDALKAAWKELDLMQLMAGEKTKPPEAEE